MKVIPTLFAVSSCALLAIGAASAQTTSPSTTQPGMTTTPPSTAPSGNPAIKSPTPNSDKSGAATGRGTGTEGQATPIALSALEAGSNSFTEGQARSRLESAGFNNLTALVKDDTGIWRGKAERNGQAVTVGLDFKGNVGSQ